MPRSGYSTALKLFHIVSAIIAFALCNQREASASEGEGVVSFSPINCNEALAKDYAASSQSYLRMLQYASLISEHDYDMHKQDGSLSAGIPGLDTIINASANYQDFQQRVKDFLSSMQASSQEFIYDTKISQSVSAGALQAFSACVQAAVDSTQDTPYAFKSDEEDDQFTLRIGYRDANGRRSIPFIFIIQNGVILDDQGQQKGGAWTTTVANNTSHDFVVFKKNPDGSGHNNFETSVTINAGGSALGTITSLHHTPTVHKILLPTYCEIVRQDNGSALVNPDPYKMGRSALAALGCRHDTDAFFAAINKSIATVFRVGCIDIALPGSFIWNGINDDHIPDECTVSDSF